MLRVRSKRCSLSEHAVSIFGKRAKANHPTSLIPSGPDLFIATSAKWPCDWDAQKFPFLAPDNWESYGKVYRVTMPGHLGAATHWTEEFERDDLQIKTETFSEMTASATHFHLSARIEAYEGGKLIFAENCWPDNQSFDQAFGL